MDLIPKPEQVISATGNVAHRLVYGHIADLRRMPRTLIDEGPLREVYHYRPVRQVRTTGDPVLLVAPLAAPSTCYDLRRGCSLVEDLVEQGRPTYLVEYGEISFRDRNLGIERWVREVVPEAVKAVSDHAGGRPVHLVGWSLGGIFAVLVTASQPRLPVATLAVVGSPFDVTQVPLVAPARPLLDFSPGDILTQAYRALGVAPSPLVQRALQVTSGSNLLTKPLAVLQHLDDEEWLAQIEAVDDFTAKMIAYPGRTYGQLYHRMIKATQLCDGVVQHDGMDIRVDAITQPVMVFAGNTDAIAPISAVRRLVDLLPNAAEVRFEIVPGGHLGMLTGRAARTTTWVVLDEWIAGHSSKPAPRSGPEQTSTEETAEAPSRRAATRKSTRGAAPGHSAVGADPQGDHGAVIPPARGRRP